MENQTYPTLLPAYSLKPLPPLLPWISDFHLSLLLPVTAYWTISLIFWFIDKKDYFSQYRLHTPAEFKQRNRVSAGEVFRAVVFQQIIQTCFGLAIGHFLGTGELYGKEEYDIAVWTIRIRRAQQAIPAVLSVLGIDTKTLGQQLEGYSQSLSLILQGNGSGMTMSYAPVSAWETWLAKAIFWVLDPVVRFGIAIFFGDSWQYFWHRAMHANQWMYRNIHAHHHRIYVPYAFGAFYNTLTEAFILDTVGATLSMMLSGLSTRQIICFSTISVMKGVDDHCGYRLPWDPLQWLGEQNTAFHDVHHQSWGIKRAFARKLQQSNYSQLYLTFWDHFCNTISSKSSEEIERLYAQGRMAAEKKQAEAERLGQLGQREST